MAPMQKWNFLINACIKCFGKKDAFVRNEPSAAAAVGTMATELCTKFFNAQIKCFGEKDVMNEIKK